VKLLNSLNQCMFTTNYHREK